ARLVLPVLALTSRTSCSVSGDQLTPLCTVRLSPAAITGSAAGDVASGVAVALPPLRSVKGPPSPGAVCLVDVGRDGCGAGVAGRASMGSTSLLAGGVSWPRVGRAGRSAMLIGRPLS